MQPLLTSFYESRQPDGSYGLTNRDLDFTRSHHLVLAYDRQLSDQLHLRLEGYHQWIFDAPVERLPSSYSLLNSGTGFGPVNRGNLVNAGLGRNYGLELTLERSFHRGYYFLLTGSVFDSRYAGSDGVWRNTAYNTHYALNALAGREISVGHKSNTLTFSGKVTTTGGRYITPIDYEASAAARTPVYRTDRAFSEQQLPYFRADVKVSYKLNRAHLTHELALDLQNVSGHKNVFQQAYNPRTNTVGTAYQQGFLPVPFYRLTF
jgi:hypothetical protein